MTMTKIIYSLFIAGALLMLGAASAWAQAGTAPSSQLGVGATDNGFTLQYAISPAFHIGTLIGLTGTSADNSSTAFAFAPYARFLLEGRVNPFIQAQISILRQDSTTNTALSVALGLEYFAGPNVGVYVAQEILEIPFADGSITRYGLRGVGSIVGLEWFFDR